MLKPEDQAAAVREKLRELNPGFDGAAFTFGLDEGAVSEVLIRPAEMLADITPLRALRGLKQLQVFDGGSFTDISALQGLPLERLEIVGPNVSDLSPLKGMPLNYLGLWPFAGTDLSPLRGMKLKAGSLGGGQILRDLEPLRGMPIEAFCFNYTSVEDLSPLKGMPLKRLEIQNTKVSDLAPLAGLPLEYLCLTGAPVADLGQLKALPMLTEVRIDFDARRDKPVLQSLRALQQVNGVPLAEFLALP